MNLLVRLSLLFLLASQVSLAGDGLVFGQLPDQFMCISFQHSYDVQNLGKSLTTHTYQAVDKDRWRTEIVDESGKGFTLTFDGSQMRSSSQSLAKKSLDEVDAFNPKVWLPRLLKLLQNAKVVKSAPSKLEGMECTRYSILDSEMSHLEVWIHNDTRMLIQVVTSSDDQTLTVDRYIWVSGQKAADCVQPEILSKEMHRIFAAKINQNIRAFESAK